MNETGSYHRLACPQGALDDGEGLLHGGRDCLLLCIIKGRQPWGRELLQQLNISIINCRIESEQI